MKPRLLPLVAWACKRVPTIEVWLPSTLRYYRIACREADCTMAL